MTRIDNYKELRVWQKALELVSQTYTITSKFPQEEKYGIISQLNRAAISVITNIAEGWGRGSTKSYILFLRISRGSLMEVDTIIAACIKLGMLKKESALLIQSLIVEISKMLNALINKVAINPK